MSTVTLDGAATEPDQAPKDNEPVADASSLEAHEAMKIDRERVRTMARRERKLTSFSRLAYGEIISRRMTQNADAFAKSHDARAGIRSQTAKLFALDLTEALATSTDDKEVYRIVRAHAAATILDDHDKDAGKAFRSLAWDAMRSIIRWVTWDGNDESYSVRFDVEVGTADDRGKTSRTVDALPLFATLVKTVAASPKSAATIRKLLDSKQEDARAAEIDLLGAKDRKRAAAARSLAESQLRRAKRTALFDNFVTACTKFGMGKEDIIAEFAARDLLPDDEDINPNTIATMSAEEATTAAKLLIAADNVDAMKALSAMIAPFLLGSDVTKSEVLSGVMTRKVA